MTELEQRRAALLLESELNRQSLRVEILRIELAVNRVRQGVASGQAVWKWFAPVAGFIVARKFGGSRTAGAMAGGSALMAIGKALWTAWRERRTEAK